MRITRQGTFASRENIAIGYWRCAYVKEDCSIIYLRPWSYPPKIPDDQWRCSNEVKKDPNATKVEHVRKVLLIPCHRCMTEHPIGAQLCAACYLPIFYGKVLPTGDTDGAARTDGVIPMWLKRYKNVRPVIWSNEDAVAIGMALYSQSPTVDARSCCSPTCTLQSSSTNRTSTASSRSSTMLPGARYFTPSTKTPWIIMLRSGWPRQSWCEDSRSTGVPCPTSLRSTRDMRQSGADA